MDEDEEEDSSDESDVEVDADKYVSSDEEEEQQGPVKAKNRKQAIQKREEKLQKDLKKEQEEMGKMLMTKKQRRIFSKVEHSQARKKDQASKLREKKAKLVSKGKK